MNREQKKLKQKILQYRETCKEFYHISNEEKCLGCPYHYENGCRIMYALRNLSHQVPSYWSGTIIEDIFKENK